MRRKPATMVSADAAAVRFAWCAAFFATLTLVAVLGIVKSAQALTLPPTGIPPLVAPAPAPEEEFEDEAEASEEEAFEADECEEEDEECEDEALPEAPPECLLSNAAATVTAAANKNRVRLELHYVTAAPTAIAVDYGLHGAKGSLHLGGEKKQLAGEGVLRLTEHLSDAKMAKVMAAKGFTVRLHVLSAPPYCKSFFDQQLNIRRATPSGFAWQQSR